ncbi:hypothetical protein CANINC_004875 [Pichia inconspicua]|uniref:PQ-loop repeat-containing protein 1 n=1 Tax=Pichia inconspicua TaxID=52247 RepID=A0A4T0WV85_9ASCO|nr:hypothetical protein CANINC_004875 [[Candida] inconspicua]
MGYFVFPPEYLPYVSTAVNFVISFTPLFSYGSTVLSIRKTQTSQGFSIDICATMLIASILRIFYYFNDPFEATLLRQCFVMVFIQTILLRVALKYRSEDAVHFEEYNSNWGDLFEKFITLNKQTIDETLESYDIEDNLKELEVSDAIKGVGIMIMKCTYLNLILILSCGVQLVKNIVRLFDYHYRRPFKFWQWKDEMSYWKFLIGFVVLLTIIQIIFVGNEYLGICFGTVSFMVESSLPLPQVLLFQRLKSVENFKTILLLSWLGGDITKISYLFFGTDNVGLIFIFAAFFQMSLNLVITYQFFYYRHLERESTDIPMTHIPNLNENNFTAMNNSRSASISLNGVITRSSSGNIIPQNQHFQGKQGNTQYEIRKSKSILNFVNEENDIEGNDNDEVDIADGVPSELLEFKQESQRRTTSIDYDTRDDNARIEHARSRAGTINSK